MTVNGYLSHRLFQGAITSKIIEDFLEVDVLPYLNPSYHILLIDNASIHQSPTIAQLCRDYGVGLEYLPPYSPDYNPIERSFKTLKAWMKKNYQQQDEWQNFKSFLEYAVRQSCYSIDCKSWYRRCGYPGVNDND